MGTAAPGLPNHTGHNKALCQRQTGGNAQGAMSMSLLMSAIIIIMTMAASHPLSVCFRRPTFHSCTLDLNKSVSHILKNWLILPRPERYCLSSFKVPVTVTFLGLSVWCDIFNTIFTLLINTKFLQSSFTFTLLSRTIFRYSVFAFAEFLHNGSVLYVWIEHISCSDNYSICRNYLGHWSGEKETAV